MCWATGGGESSQQVLNISGNFFKTIPGDYLMKPVERIPRVLKANWAIKAWSKQKADILKNLDFSVVCLVFLWLWVLQ